jgi:hypothetical protein
MMYNCPEFQAINPWDGMFSTCFGGGDIYELLIHEREGPNAGKWTNRAITLEKAVQVRAGCVLFIERPSLHRIQCEASR